MSFVTMVFYLGQRHKFYKVNHFRLSLDKAMCIPWLRYINITYSRLFNLSIQPNAIQVTTLTKRTIKDIFMNYRAESRMRLEGKKTTVILIQTLQLEEDFQSYLTQVTNPMHRFVLIRFRLGIVHHLVAFPP